MWKKAHSRWARDEGGCRNTCSQHEYSWKSRKSIYGHEHRDTHAHMHQNKYENWKPALILRHYLIYNNVSASSWIEIVVCTVEKVESLRERVDIIIKFLFPPFGILFNTSYWMTFNSFRFVHCVHVSVFFPLCEDVSCASPKCRLFRQLTLKCYLPKYVCEYAELMNVPSVL